MVFIFCALGLLIASGFCAFCLNRSARLANHIGAVGAAVASLVGLGFLLAKDGPATLTWPWPVPGGSLSVCVDPLGSLFLIVIFVLSALFALYGAGYLQHYEGKKNLGTSWFFFNLLVASMVLTVIARNAVLFLIFWELMSVSSFFLVIFEGEKKQVTRAGLIYLVATHIGTLFLLVMFLLLGNHYGSFDLGQWQPAPTGSLPSIIFLLSLIGFGTKAGFMPLHIWLPEAHPAAPSHVSALMSGVMIKMGVYGFVRILTFLGTPLAWWGYFLIAVGAISGVLGILFALAQHDLKRLLAYSSIENIGIIALGLGLGVLGSSMNDPVMMALGFAGGLFHLVNHAVFKGLLFLGSGAVLQGAGTLEIDVLGGLYKKIPVTGSCFLVGAAAICGLPPLNGFVSEFLIYFSSLRGALGPLAVAGAGLVAATALAAIGGLVAACFTKAFGIIFLGEARSEHGREAQEPGARMRWPMVVLAASCVLIPLISPFILLAFDGIIADLTQTPQAVVQAALESAIVPCVWFVAVTALLYIGLVLLIALRRALLAGKAIGRGPTWDCGYARPTTRMQYTGSSYAQPIVDFAKGILSPLKHIPVFREYFPQRTSFKTETADMFQEKFFRPAFRLVHRLAGRFTWFQHGKLQLYILYILFSLIVLLIWKL